MRKMSPPPLLSRNLDFYLRIHQSSYPCDVVSGMRWYADRALLLPGVAFVHEGEDLEEYLAYLASLHIGARPIFIVPDGDIYEYIARSDEYKTRIRDLLANGLKIQFFNTTEKEQNFLFALGLDWQNAFSAPPFVSLAVDDKASLRRFSEKLECESVFPAHIFCRTEAEVLGAAKFVMERHGADFPVLKRTDLVSGTGMIKIRVDSESLMRAQIKGYFAKFVKNNEEVILEAGYEHIPLSVMWEIGESGVRARSVTRQIIDEHFVHQGNIISGTLPPDVSEEDKDTMIIKTAPFVLALERRGYRGICGFDLMKTIDGRIFVLECNARVTATTYAVGVADQIEKTRGERPWAIHMQNLYPKDVRNFAELRKKLSSKGWDPLLYGDSSDRASGVLPFNVRCLNLQEPKCGLMCIADNPEDAADLYKLAVLRTS